MTSAGSVTAAITPALILLCSASLVKSDGVWDQWSDYSPCSRSCGGGVQSRTRGCLHMGSGQGNGCVGPGDEYMSCETEVCPRGSEDFRSMQCSKFNEIPMILNGHARRYQWVPHFDEKNRCALKCHAIGTSIVRELEEKVVDGTQCDSPEKFGVCVGGVCQEVGCDRLIGSVMREDKCRVCGGDGSACRTEQGLYSQANLNVGYHEFLTIPMGSTSINITKMKPSHSYLAMKSDRGHFYINGGRDRTSKKAFAGTIFQYYSAVGTDTTDTESILARGPTNETLVVMLVSRGSNPGVRHEYSTPQALVEKAGDSAERFTWVYGRWTRCSQACGTGYQLRAVSCMDRVSGGTVNGRSCNVRTRPRGNQTCNMGTCAEDRTNGYSWVLGHWDECSVVCGVGEQTQLAYCQEKGTMGQTIYVSDDICMRYLGEKPLYKRVCRGEAGCPHWSTGAWNECGVTCGIGYQTRRVFCHRLTEAEESTKVPDSECKSADRPDERKPCQLARCPGHRDDRLQELEGRNETVIPVKCSETQYGCCPDGVTTAVDKQHINCPAHTAGITECKLERSRGPCANYTLKWYYDEQTSLCNMFWYGGCGGNDNRFDTEEECEYKCVTNDGTGGAPCSPGSSRCRSTAMCVPKTRLCDGFNDCGDNSDELNCAAVPDNQCGEGSSMCRGVKKCVSDSRRCDGYDDCGDNSDEENCEIDTVNQCGAGSSMCRGVKKCVSDSRRCDGYDDCGDNSDEENCDTDTVNQCGAGSSMCRGVKKCVSDARRCDGYDDCGDNSDEENCGKDTVNQCGAGSSMCRGVKKCVSDSRRCDGYDDCGDNSDEENCDTDTVNQCGAGSSMCRGVKKCVSDARRCDGYDDCGDNSDEENCGTDTVNQCGAGSSMCRGVKKCVSDARRCDGYDDCGDNSDEENCGDRGGRGRCTPGSSMCRSVRRCVSDARRCDGYDDCGDNSDEEDCSTTDNNVDNPCGRGRSMCRSVRKCVSVARRCDGVDDCGDRSDEENCQDVIDNSLNNPCGQGRSMCRSVRKCVSDARKCDGVDDCGDRSDEENCQDVIDNSLNNPCGRGRSMCRSVRKCVSDARKCDGIDDCGDRSDEENCQDIDNSLNNPCGRGRSMCRSVRKCVSDARKCDGVDDCGDRSDEENCQDVIDNSLNNPCGQGRSMCRSVRKCVSDARRCDGVDDCGDRSDEENCQSVKDKQELENSLNNPCGRGRSMCRSVRKCVSDAQRCDGCSQVSPQCIATWRCGLSPCNRQQNPCGRGRSMCRSVRKCVSDSRRCNGHDDCGDNSDEENCFPGNTNQCGAGSSMCRGVKKCVSDARRCDGYDDCGDNSDEENCGTDTVNQCGAGSSMCRGVKKCVSDARRCDGYDDCGDNSDEENCGTVTGNQCGEGRKMCRGVKKCVAESQWCDGYDDCGDNSDEDGCIDQGGYWDKQCGKGSSMCRGVKKCVSDVRRCDGNDDCGDNSDEEGCDDDNISIECGTSDYGCCPDGQTAATGPNQEGCPSIPTTGCRTSRYGCCQDQVTSASGPNEQGCPQSGVFDTASCGLEKVKGDCGQWEAQWHFSTTTGACTQFWYGGCGGNANRFTNKTECETSCVHVKGPGLCRLPMSTGPCRAKKQRYYFDFKSGECKKFNYGGCRGNSNRFRSKAECEMKCSDSTYIDSEDDDGPRCKSSRYGCCPDMKTPARGLNKYGCVKSCKTSRYGCCDDGVTAAEGPQQYGCEESSGMEPCEESMYGCCSDGVSRASGYNQEGCTDQDVVIFSTQTPIHTTDDPCAQEKDSTRCKDFVVKWFWDREKQRCDRFWFGGCEGSMNKFDSEEDCLGRCRNSLEKPATNKCELPRETGPCRALLTRWYFDKYSQQCMTFIYGGCQGNKNNFLSESECRRHCGGRVATPAPTQAPTLPPTTTTTTTVSPGVRPEETSVEMSGETYVKEGRQLLINCEAVTSSTSSSRVIEWFLNGNRIEESDRVQVTTSLSGYTMYSKLSVQRAEKSDSGTYYCRSLPDGDVKMRYITVVDVSYEVTTVPPTYPPDFYTTARPRPTQPREVCMQEKAPGRCYASIPKWFYDHKDGVCREFIYGGCDGNENNFNTKEECDTFCRPEEICVLRRETGRCRALIPRWTYDESSNMCVEFNYGGCGGNPNNFGSKDSCERRCRTKQMEKPEKPGRHVCSLPRAGGTCGEYNILWYYDKDYRRCSRFIYTGCGGNGNRFQSEDDCQAACEGGEVVVTTLAPTKSPRRETAVCDLRPDNARCDSNNDVADYKIKWYFDYERSVCARFYYGGCGGNANRFDSRQECQSACVYGKKVVTTTPVPTTPPTTVPLHCRYSTHGCCQDDETTAVDEYHSNCYDGPNVIERRKGEDYEILVRPGSDVLINCRIHRMENDIVMWYRDRFAVKTGYRTTLYNNGSLLITGMRPEDGGVYSCQVSGGNNVPQIERYNVMVQIPLRILNSPKIIKIRPGDNAFLHCQVYGQPTPTVTWMTRGRPVGSSGRYRAFENGTLIISAAEESDAGEYECHAENGVSHMVKKKVQLRIRAPVRAKLDPYKGKVVEGGTVRLRCTGSGYPRPTMHWERDGEKLTSGNKISVTGRELVIRNAAIEDSGIYICVVKNHHHESRAATVVQVDMQPMSETCEDSMSKMKCKMIRTARLCGHRTFSKMCCETCASYRYR